MPFSPSPLQSSRCTAPKRRDPRYRRPTVEEVAILALLAEMVAIPFDQLARFLEVDLDEVVRIVHRLEETGCIKHAQFFNSEAAWVWIPGHRGARFSGTGFRPCTPMTRLLPHRRAVNEACLHLRQRAPQGRWVSERVLRHTLDPRATLPDAVFEIDGERHAIEVELTPKSKIATPHILAEHSARYDAVVYFCSPPARRHLERHQAEYHWPKLIIRDLPGEQPAPAPSSTAVQPAIASTPPARRVCMRALRDPYSWEVQILRLIAEQGAISLDQLSRFLGCSLLQAQRIALHLEALRYAKQSEIFFAESAWIWLTTPGARLSGTELGCSSLGPVAFERIRAVNEVRLHLAAQAPDALWVSRRLLARALPPRGPNTLPAALLRVGSERHAIEVRLRDTPAPRLIRLIDHCSAQYDAVIYFCTPAPRRQLQRLQAQHHWPRLDIRDLPPTVVERLPSL